MKENFNIELTNVVILENTNLQKDLLAALKTKVVSIDFCGHTVKLQQCMNEVIFYLNGNRIWSANCYTNGGTRILPNACEELKEAFCEAETMVRLMDRGNGKVLDTYAEIYTGTEEDGFGMNTMPVYVDAYVYNENGENYITLEKQTDKLAWESQGYKMVFDSPLCRQFSKKNEKGEYDIVEYHKVNTMARIPLEHITKEKVADAAKEYFESED